MKQAIFIFGLSVLLQSCLVSRTRRPKLTGYIFDLENKKPLENCTIGGTFTDSTGYYELEELRYRQFTWMGFEAPPLRVFEIAEKADYISDTIQAYNKYGGGMRKGAHWDMDTLFLKRKL